jgi:hypothetical protein
LFLWIILSRARIGFIRSLGVAAVVLLITSPWWATVISYHGIGPLLNAAQTGQKSSAVLHLLFFAFAEEPYATFIAVFGLMGLVYSLIHKNYLLPLWMALPFIVEGRSATGPAAIPLAMLAAIGLLDIALPSLLSLARKDLEQSDNKVSAIELGFLIYLTLYLFFSAYQFGTQLPGTSLHSSDREAMYWISKNARTDARFLVLTGTTSISCDSVLEWFPALTDRQSIYTVQGTEWTKGKNFVDFVRSTYAVQNCLSAEDLTCLDAAVDRSQYDYIYISKLLRTNSCGLVSPPRTFPFFLQSIRTVQSFNAIYETDDVVIFEKR